MAITSQDSQSLEQLRFLTPHEVKHIQNRRWTPTYVYDQKLAEENADKFLNFPNAYWLTVRYAMKTNPNINLLRLFTNKWLHIDASSWFEVIRAMNWWIHPRNIQLTAQEFPDEMKELFQSSLMFNATSLNQLEKYWKLRPGRDVSVRINPGLWSGGTKRTNTWGPASSFWIWHEYIDQIKEIAQRYNLKITKLHTHIWSWSDPKVWTRVSKMSLALANHFPDVHTLNLWGWFKVWRMSYEESADLQKIWEEVKQNFIRFYKKTGRQLKLEIEPGTALMANVWSIIATVKDLVDTWLKWNKFIKTDTGMTENARISLYWAQHPIVVVTDWEETDEFIVTWHCCESWDIMTPAKWKPEDLKPRLLKQPKIWDPIVIEWAWSYCAWMSTKNYNSFPEASEILRTTKWKFIVIRARQRIEQITQNEKKKSD